MKSAYTTIAAQRLRIRRTWWMGLYRYTRWRWHVAFAVLDALGWCLFGAWHVLCRWRHRRRAVERDPRSILVLQLDHLGDAVMSLALIHSLRRRYPDARCEVLCGPANRELFESLSAVDAVHCLAATRFSRRGSSLPPFTRGGWGGWLIELLRCAWRLRRRKFDLAIDVRGEFPHPLLMWLAGARRRLGWSSGGGGFLLTDRLRHVAGQHEVLSRAALLSALGIRELGVEGPYFRPDLAAMRFIDDRLAQEAWPAWQGDGLSGWAGPPPLIVLHVGAGTPAKQWPTRHWRELVGRLIVELDARIVLVGGTEDRSRAAAILCDETAQERLAWPQVKNWTGQLSVTQLAALVQRADLFVGADSGPAHLAAAVGTPVVVLFSGTNDARQWRPWGRNVAVVRHAPACSPCHREVCPWADHPCMDGLRPQAVFVAARELLSRRFASELWGRLSSLPGRQECLPHDKSHVVRVPNPAHGVCGLHSRFMEGDPHGNANEAACAPRETKMVA